MGGCCLILFGTGGVRGIMKKGEFDEQLVVVVSQAVATWLHEERLNGVVIAYDTRKNSNLFARLAANTFVESGIDVFIFEEPVPTPLLSFAVREMSMGAGIVITASHNPPEYNGYKVYTGDGVQAIPEYTEKIASMIGKNYRTSRVGVLRSVPREVEEKYFERLSNLVEKYVNSPTKIVYSPLQGTGARFVPRILRQLGFEVFCVANQMEFDPNFSKVSSLNPEYDEAFDGVRKLCEEENVRFGIATDPDCDRVGLIVDGKKLTGNQVGILLTEMLRHEAPQGSCLIKTIVTTDMVIPMCEELGLRVLETPTGFKYIGHLIETKLKELGSDYFFAFEESCGYLAGNFVRDKDGVLGSALIASLCSRYEPLELLKSLYETYGYYRETLVSIPFESVSQAIKKYEELKLHPPQILAGFSVIAVHNYENDPEIPNETLLIELDGVKIYIRPSGTEPKLKIYIKVVGSDENEVESRLNSIERAVVRI